MKCLTTIEQLMTGQDNNKKINNEAKFERSGKVHFIRSIHTVEPDEDKELIVSQKYLIKQDAVENNRNTENIDLSQQVVKEGVKINIKPP